MPYGRIVAAASFAGVRWSPVPVAPNEVWQALNWNQDNSRWAAISSGAGATSMTSPDGQAWTLSPTPPPVGLWRDLDSSSDLGQMIAASASNSMQFSISLDGGLTWDAGAAPFPAINGFNGILWAALLNLWIATTSQAGAQTVATSPDGVNWTLRNSPNLTPARGCIAFAPEIPRVVIGYSDGTIIHSNDGINWNTASAPVAGASLSGVIWHPGLQLFVGCCQGIGGGASAVAVTSPDGDVWASTPMSQLAVWTSIAFSSTADRIVAVNNNVSLINGGSRFASTQDGINWTAEYGPTLDYIDVAAGGPTDELFVAITPVVPALNSQVAFSE